MKTKVEYFGYGANRDPFMMKAIIGRIPEGYPATISGYELAIQSWNDIPEKIQKELKPSWGEDFKTYCLVPSKNHKRKQVKGIVWKITQTERKLIDKWEMTGIWYKAVLLQYLAGQGENIQVEVQIMDDLPITKTVNGLRYKTFINDKTKMLEIAKRLRTD
jgi:hypothetical protein